MLIAIMTELFAVVKFTEENDAIDVVPTMWIINNDTASWYPNVTSDETKNSLVKRCAQVDTKTWTENPIKVLGKYKTYHEAMEKVHIAEVQSNLSDDTVVTQKKRSRKRKNLKLPGEDSTSETDAEGSRKETRKHHKKSQSKLAANGSGKLVYKNFPDPPSISPKRSNVLNFNNEARIDVSDSSSSAHEYLGSDDDVVHPVVHQQVPSQTAPQKANSQADGMCFFSYCRI
nr:PREDICTED: uncharacterized protein LOC109039754 isoform X2 [Bemisia tabaci]